MMDAGGAGRRRARPAGRARRQLLRDDHAALRRASSPLFDVIDDHPSLDDRLVGTGRLAASRTRANSAAPATWARRAVWPSTLRRDSPYAPYDGLRGCPGIETDGDVAARVRVRMQEIRQSLELMDRLLATLPAGETLVPLPTPAAGAVGLGLVDGWRGEILTFVRFGAERPHRPLLPARPELVHLAGPGAADHGQHRPGLPGLQ